MNFDNQEYYPQPESKGGWRWLHMQRLRTDEQ